MPHLFTVPNKDLSTIRINNAIYIDTPLKSAFCCLDPTLFNDTLLYIARLIFLKRRQRQDQLCIHAYQIFCHKLLI